MNEVPEEVVVGVHHSGLTLEEGIRTGGNYYCASCKNNIHCYVEVKENKAEIVITCTNDKCKCKCKTHFACKRCGYLHPYGNKCNRNEEEVVRNAKNDKAFDKIMDKWRNKK